MDLTDRAWMIVQRASEEAQVRGQEHVGSDHMLLAMLSDGDGAAAHLLTELGIAYSDVAERLEIGASR